MIITFSILSFIYALFYAIIMFSKANINYVEDIISLNVQKLKNKDVEPVSFSKRKIMIPSIPIPKEY